MVPRGRELCAVGKRETNVVAHDRRRRGLLPGEQSGVREQAAGDHDPPCARRRCGREHLGKSCHVAVRNNRNGNALHSEGDCAVTHRRRWAFALRPPVNRQPRGAGSLELANQINRSSQVSVDAHLDCHRERRRGRCAPDQID
eukprot:Amastigsp_a261_101.p2 type:complete len:143 gc:universal Amastigsp_a261_101:847-419(-)